MMAGIRTKGPDHPSARYSHAEIDKIAALLKDGYSARQIAKEMSRTKGQIIGVVNRNDTLRAIGFERTNRKRLAGTAPVVKPTPTPKPQNIVRKRNSRQYDPGYRAVNKTDGLTRQNNIPFKNGAIPKPVDVGIASKDISLLDLQPGQCRYPTNDAAPGKQHLFCGHETKEGSSYCRAHDRLCHSVRVRLEDAA